MTSLGGCVQGHPDLERILLLKKPRIMNGNEYHKL